MGEFESFVQGKILVLLDYFHEVCQAEGIDYSLAYGTLLGAVRHQGLIPWDDDADVFMLRDEYEKFARAVKKYPRDDVYFRENHYWIKKVVFTTPPDYLGKKIVGDEIHLDIFIFDELPSGERERGRQIFALRKLQGMMSVEKIFGLRRPLKDKLLMLGTRILGRLHRRSVLCRRYTKESIRYNGSNSDEYFNSNHGFYGIKRVFPREWLSHTQPCPFEGREYRIFSAFEPLLTMLYGDYRQLPPEEERVMPHIKLKD